MPGSSAPLIRRRAVLASAAVVLGSVLGGCGFSVRKTSGPPGFSAEELVDSAEFSTLDELGIARAKTSKSLRVDFRGGSIAKSDVGLQDSAYGPEVIAPDGEMLRLTIRGTGGTLDAATDHVRFFTTDTSPELTMVTYFLTAETLDEYVQLLRDAVREYGLDAEAVERWVEETKRDPGDKASYAIGSESDKGFYVGYDLRYDGSKEIQLIIVTVSRLS